MVANHPAAELSDLQQRAIALESHAQARTQAYRRATWVRFVGVFFPIPFIVVLLRLEMAAWTYYVWGALILLGGAALYVIDTAASTRVDEAVEAAATARKAYEEAAQGGVTPP
jgi:bacteriorhodopsin